MSDPLAGLYAQAEVNTPDGPKTYTFQLLKRKKAARVFHESLQQIIKLIAGAVDKNAGTAGLIQAVESLDFNTFWGLAQTLLRGGNVRPDPENAGHVVPFGNLDETDYFEDCREELYLAVYHALKVNYPKSFSRLATKLGDFGQQIEAMAGQASSIASTPALSRESPSPSGTD
jgi:hypothetical protein